MFKNIFTIHKIKKLRENNINNQFLAAFRNELADYMTKNPVMKKGDVRLPKVGGLNNFTYFNKLNFKLMPVLIIALIALITTGGGVAAASQTSLPNDALYPVKILTEEVREAVTFDNAAKVKLHAKYAADRVAELQKMLDEKGVDAKGLDVALANLKEHVDRSAEIIDQERGRGKDVNALAKEVQNRIEKAKNDLEDELESTEVVAKNDEEKKMLRERVENIKREMEFNEDRIGKSEEFKEEAEEAMIEAQKKLVEITQKGLASSTELIKFNSFMDKASSSLLQEHWVQARQHAKQAEKALEKVERKIEKAHEEESDDGEAKEQSKTKEQVKTREQIKTRERVEIKEQAEVKEQVEVEEQTETKEQENDATTSSPEKDEGAQGVEDVEDDNVVTPTRNGQ